MEQARMNHLENRCERLRRGQEELLFKVEMIQSEIAAMREEQRQSSRRTEMMISTLLKGKVLEAMQGMTGDISGTPPLQAVTPSPEIAAIREEQRQSNQRIEMMMSTLLAGKAIRPMEGMIGGASRTPPLPAATPSSEIVAMKEEQRQFNGRMEMMISTLLRNQTLGPTEAMVRGASNVPPPTAMAPSWIPYTPPPNPYAPPRAPTLIIPKKNWPILQPKVSKPLPVCPSVVLPYLFESKLLQPAYRTPVQPPYPPWYKPNERCGYHQGFIGHSTDRCPALKFKIEKLIEDKLLPMELIEKIPPPSVNEENPYVVAGKNLEEGGDSDNLKSPVIPAIIPGASGVGHHSVGGIRAVWTPTSSRTSNWIINELSTVAPPEE